MIRGFDLLDIGLVTWNMAGDICFMVHLDQYRIWIGDLLLPF